LQPANTSAAPLPSGGLQPVPVTPVNYSNPTPDPLDALKPFNVISQEQKAVPGGVQFTCRIANPHDPDLVRVYEATAVDYPSAVRAVVDQINQNR
jgi:hypothetical protein